MVQSIKLHTHFLSFRSIKPFVKKKTLFAFDCKDILNKTKSRKLNPNENLYEKRKFLYIYDH